MSIFTARRVEYWLKEMLPTPEELQSMPRRPLVEVHIRAVVAGLRALHGGEQDPLEWCGVPMGFPMWALPDWAKVEELT